MTQPRDGVCSHCQQTICACGRCECWTTPCVCDCDDHVDPGQLRIYEFDYPGLALGGVCVVLAHGMDAAREIAIKATECDPKQLRCIEKVKPFVGPGVVYNWNGDY